MTTIQVRAVGALPTARLQTVSGWAMAQRAAGYVWRPDSLDEVRAVLALARSAGRTIVPRGSGYSYGDTALNAEDIVLDLTRMRRVLAWDAATGTITVEPGVTVRDLWHVTLPDGWWPAAIPGAMYPSLGGCVSTNVHGKDAWRVGPIGEHIVSLDVMTPDGTIATIVPQSDPTLFRAIIGGLGMLGIVTSVTLQMRRVVAGTVITRRRAARSLAEMFAIFAEESPTADYLVGWIDGFAMGEHLGRGLVERADYPSDPDEASLRAEAQDLPARIAGIMPRSELWRVMRLATNDAGMHFANAMQYAQGSRQARPHHVPLARFHFFHDYIPGWQRSWLPGGLRQFQAFVPASVAREVFADLLARSHRAGLTPYLCVFKQHRADDFLLSYQCDGFSLSLDYHVTASNAHRLDALLIGMRDATIDAGGRLYLAKDDTLDIASYARMMGSDRIARFLALKRSRDPQGALSSNLFRRVFPAE
jgi:decaprenylphospho-beta-D-ribofuranose 2-oxidase